MQLGDSLSFLTSGSRGWSKYYRDSGALFLRIQNVGYNELRLEDVAFVQPPDNAEAVRTKVQPGDILLSITADLGRTAVIPEGLGEAYANQHLAVLRVNNIDANFLSAFLASDLGQKQLKRLDRVGVKSGLNFDDIRSLQIPLPPPSEQRRIAAILDKAAAIRRKRQEALALTDEFLRSAFLEMFGDPVTNPKGWEVVTVGDVTSNVRDGPHVSPKYAASGVPFLSTRNIRPGRIVFDDLKFVTQKDYEELTRKFRAGRGDVLLTKGGTTGYAKVVDFDWPFTIWVHVAVLRPTARIRPEFLEAALNSPNCYAQSQKYTHGITNKDLGLTRIRRITLTLPPISLQDEYCRIRNNSLVLSQKSEESLLEAERMFDSLTQRAFRGEL